MKISRQILFAFLALVVALVSGCNSTSKPQTGSFSGSIVLSNDTGDSFLDPVDYGGVSVALYHLTKLDSTIVRINGEYPQIGVRISQETEFDHRLQSPILKTQTLADGSFTFPKLSAGHYNLVLFKENWSLRYFYNVEIKAGDNSLRDLIGECKLYPARTMNPVIQPDLVFEPNRTYVFNADTVIFGNAHFQTHSTILIAPDKRITFNGNVNISGNDGVVRITSLSQTYSTEIQEVEPFHLISFTVNSSLDIDGLVLDHSREGMEIRSKHASMGNMAIRKCINAMTIFSEDVSIKNLILSETTNRGIVAYGSLNLQKSILYNNNDACFLSEATASVYNNYVNKNYIGLRPFYGEIEVHNNCFDQNSNAIALCVSDPYIHKNNFYDNKRDIELNGYYVQQSMDYCNPTIENNNFYGNSWYYHTKGNNSVYSGEHSIVGINQNQRYPNSYYRSADLVSHIFDANNPLATNLQYVINCEPRRSMPYGLAGINNR